MKWGVRRYQDKNGRLTSDGKKRYVADKTKYIQRDIDSLSGHRKTGMKAKNGRTLMTAKEVNDSIAALEREKSKVANKAGAKYDKAAKKSNFKADVKDFKKRGFEIDYEIDLGTGEFKVSQYYNSRGEKIGRDYAEKVIAKSRKDNAVSTLVGTTAVLVGASFVSALLE